MIKVSGNFTKKENEKKVFFISFPYNEEKKEKIKKLGGRWDSFNKAWKFTSLKGIDLRTVDSDIRLSDDLATWFIINREKISDDNKYLLDIARKMIAEEMDLPLDEVNEFIDESEETRKKLLEAKGVK